MLLYSWQLCIQPLLPLPPRFFLLVISCLPAVLTGMVKVLRRGMKELQNRTQQFIDHAVTYEKEAAQQVR